MLLAYAYRLRDEQIVGGPAWISSALWEVSAKAEDSSIPAIPATFDPAVPDAMALMVQALIEDRFHLKSHREVKVDRTNLNGLFDFKLQWAQDPMTLGINARGAANGATGPSIFTAVQEQLGLKLQSSKGPVEVLVIDSVSKPSEN
jgi:hypothetical protein